MNIKTQLVTIGAALAATVAMASPASATIYQYTLANNDVVRIDNVTGTATFKGTNINVQMASAEFKSFMGGEAAVVNFGATLTSLTGTRFFTGIGQLIPITLVGQNPLRTFTLQGGVAFLNTHWGTGNIDDGFLTDNYANSIVAYAVDPTAVPEPAMLGLFGAGAVMVMMGRRRRLSGKAVAGTGKLVLAC
ncbi:PEP-CTERM sorting domain-containing protein [Aquisediminimonas sediminicola]|uniref:PEP-CTERM sorting domain-containing protein n=1 Tax=Alteraquisediminimonas sediminicola TaxID=2676787 RepID=UPI001C8E3CF5|nr:PEP-CTERM sorting domain-containing protein [Aquisediminimonas sediminicola]